MIVRSCDVSILNEWEAEAMGDKSPKNKEKKKAKKDPKAAPKTPAKK